MRKIEGAVKANFLTFIIKPLCAYLAMLVRFGTLSVWKNKISLLGYDLCFGYVNACGLIIWL